MSIKQQESQKPTNHEQLLRGLIKTRKQIVDKIAHLSKKRYFLQAQPKSKQNLQQNGEIEGQPRKMVKMDSCASIQGVSDHNTSKKQQRIRSSNSLAGSQVKSQTINKMNQQNVQRNRRMFQGLNLYLDKAKNKLQQQKTKRQETNKILQKIHQKQKQKSQQLLREELQKLQVQYSQYEKLKSENSKQILRIQNLLLKQSYLKYANALKSFTFTRAQPSISWRPTKDIQKLAKKLLDQREQEIKQKNSKIIESIQKYENRFDFSLYLYENEQQYYANMIKNYYRDIVSFFKTETEPQILWKPAKQYQGSDKLNLPHTKKVEMILQQNRAEAQSYYKQRTGHLKQRREKGQIEQQQGQSNNSQSPHHKQEQD